MIEVAGALRPRRGERLCGDAWLHLERDGRALIALIDALGHGPQAASTAAIALRFLNETVPAGPALDDLSALMVGLHRALRGSRGIVGALALVDPRRCQLQYLAVGNTEARIFGAREVRLLSSFGLLGGGRMPQLRPQLYELAADGMVVLHTDGLAGMQPGNLSRSVSCAETARHLLERWARGDDDACVVVLRLGASC